MRNKEKHLVIKDQFKEATKYLRKCSIWVYFSVGLFLLAAIVGMSYAKNLGFLDKFLEELISKTEGLNAIEMIFFILQNNMQSALLSIIGGLFLGIVPIINSISNGVILGYVLKKAAEVAGVSVWWRLLPHGIFELPAIFISLGVGTKFGFGFVNNFIKHYWKKSKILTLAPLFLALIFSIMGLMSKESIVETLPKEVVESFTLQMRTVISYASFSFTLILEIIFFYLVFILVTSMTNKKLRNIQNAYLNYNFYNSLNVFLFIIIPLLIVAAIIEGLLIAFVG